MLLLDICPLQDMIKALHLQYTCPVTAAGMHKLGCNRPVKTQVPEGIC